MGAGLLIIVAIVGGMAITLQSQLMGLMDQSLGTKESVFITYMGGALVICMIVLATRGSNLRMWQDVPRYTLSAGAIGLVIVGSIGYVVPRLGLSTAFTLIVASQFVLASLIDHFGLLGASLRPLDGSRILGLLVLIFGVWLSNK
jgi:transporter family-2 protein